MSVFSRLLYWKHDPHPVERDAIYLFADCNYFYHCKSPKNDYWLDSFDTSDDIILVVTSPILREIDQHKDMHKVSHVHKKAKELSGILGGILGAGEYHTYRESSPRVRLTLRNDLRPVRWFKKGLDYESNDHRYIGAALRFRRRYHRCDVRLLTRDNPAKAAGRTAGLHVMDVPLSWENDKGTTEEERLIQSLQAENKALRATDPSITISLIDASILGDDDPDSLGYAFIKRRFRPLSDEQIDTLMTRIERHFPIVTDYRPNPPQNNPKQSPAYQFRLLAKGKWIEPSDDEIRQYREVAYPDWVAEIRKQLEELHSSLAAREPKMEVGVVVDNCGTVPARSAKVSIGFTNAFWLHVPFDQENDKHDPLTLSAPPPAPKGDWQMMRFARSMDVLQHGFAVDNLFGITRADASRDLSSLRIPPEKNPHGFYWGERDATEPGDYVTCLCQEWRHSEGAEAFWLDIEPMKTPLVEGLLIVKVSAANLQRPIQNNSRFRSTILKRNVSKKQSVWFLASLSRVENKGSCSCIRRSNW